MSKITGIHLWEILFFLIISISNISCKDTNPFHNDWYLLNDNGDSLPVLNWDKNAHDHIYTHYQHQNHFYDKRYVPIRTVHLELVYRKPEVDLIYLDYPDRKISTGLIASIFSKDSTNYNATSGILSLFINNKRRFFVQKSKAKNFPLKITTVYRATPSEITPYLGNWYQLNDRGDSLPLLYKHYWTRGLQRLPLNKKELAHFLGDYEPIRKLCFTSTQLLDSASQKKELSWCNNKYKIAYFRVGTQLMFSIYGHNPVFFDRNKIFDDLAYHPLKPIQDKNYLMNVGTFTRAYNFIKADSIDRVPISLEDTPDDELITNPDFTGIYRHNISKKKGFESPTKDSADVVILKKDSIILHGKSYPVYYIREETPELIKTHIICNQANCGWSQLLSSYDTTGLHTIRVDEKNYRLYDLQIPSLQVVRRIIIE